MATTSSPECSVQTKVLKFNQHGMASLDMSWCTLKVLKFLEHGMASPIPCCVFVVIALLCMVMLLYMFAVLVVFVRASSQGRPRDTHVSSGSPNNVFTFRLVYQAYSTMHTFQG